MADGHYVTAKEKWKIKLEDKDDNVIEACLVVTDALEEDMTMGMNVLKNGPKMEGFAIAPKQGILQVNRHGSF